MFFLFFGGGGIWQGLHRCHIVQLGAQLLLLYLNHLLGGVVALGCCTANAQATYPIWTHACAYAIAGLPTLKAVLAACGKHLRLNHAFYKRPMHL